MRGNCNVLGTIPKKNRKIEIEKENTKIEKDGNESVVTISYKTKCIDSARFMVSYLSNLVDYLAEEIHKIKCKYCDFFLEYKRSRLI